MAVYAVTETANNTASASRCDRGMEANRRMAPVIIGQPGVQDTVRSLDGA
jgi:hypothetical protein